MVWNNSTATGMCEHKIFFMFSNLKIALKLFLLLKTLAVS